MDNTQNNGMDPQQPVAAQDPNAAAPVMDMNQTQSVSSMGDLAGMTPPPAPMQDMSAPAPVAMPEPAPVPTGMTDTSYQTPSVPTSPMSDMNTSMSMPQSQPVADMSPMPASAPAENGEADDYAYAEDLLDEILDSLDRIEAKLEAIEKKVGQ